VTFLKEQIGPWKSVSRAGAIGWLVFYIIFFLYAAFNHSGFLFLDYVNLIIHEGGHFFFSWFGYTITILGGTLGELIVPLLCGIYFFRQREVTALAFCSFWFFENFLYIGTYMADARALALPLVGSGKENPYLLQQELQQAMQEGAGLAREEKSLKTCLDQVLELRQRAARIHVPGSRKYNPGWHTARDLRFMLTIAEAIVRAAIERRESRGAHWRLDYLEKDPALGRVNFIAYNDGGAVKLKTRPVPEMPLELAKLFADAESPPPASQPPAASPPKPQPVRT